MNPSNIELTEAIPAPGLPDTQYDNNVVIIDYYTNGDIFITFNEGGLIHIEMESGEWDQFIDTKITTWLTLTI